MAVGGEIAELVIGAGAKPEAQPVQPGVRRWRGAGMGGEAGLAAGDEAWRLCKFYER